MSTGKNPLFRVKINPLPVNREEEKGFRRRYPTGTKEIKEEYFQPRREYKGAREARRGERALAQSVGHESWTPEFAIPGTMTRAFTAPINEAEINAQYNARELGATEIELYDPLSYKRSPVTVNLKTPKIKFDKEKQKLTVCNMMSCVVYALTAAGAAFVAAKLAGLVGGKKSRRKRRNKSKHNKSKHNKSNKNKRRSNQRR